MHHYDRDSQSRPPLPGAGYMEDYTNAFLVSAGALCFLILCVLWVMFGLPFVAVAAYGIDRLFLRRS